MITRTEQDWATLNALEARGLTLDEILEAGVDQFLGKIEREEALIKVPDVKAINGWLVTRKEDGVLRPRLVTRFKRPSIKYQFEIVIYSVTRFRDTGDIFTSRYKIEYKLKDEFFVTNKRGDFIDLYILNHFGFFK